MPYIKKDDRHFLDPIINKLVDRIEELDHGTDLAGLLNYCCTCIALRAIKRRYKHLSYWAVCMVSGVFSNISSEFYRRVAAPYEDWKRTENGDLEEFIPGDRTV